MDAQRNSYNYCKGRRSTQSAGGQGIKAQLRLRDGSCLSRGSQRQQNPRGYRQGAGLQQRLRDGSCLNQTQ
jgi:hypothetical protein